MKIVHLITRLLRAGSEENTIYTCLHQAQSGNQVYLMHGNDYYKGHYEKLGKKLNLVEVPSMVHQIDPVKDFASVVALARMFRKIQPDVVHTHQSKAGVLGRVAAKLAGVPSIVHTVHIAPFVHAAGKSRLVYVYAERMMAAITDAMIDVSHGMKDVCLAERVGTPEMHRVIRSGMPLESFAKAVPPENWASRIGWTGDGRPKTALILAALEPRKRHREFITALAPHIRGRKDFRLMLAGEGSLLSQVQAVIESEGVCEQVKILGYDSNPEKLVALADVCVLPSAQEGLPRVAVQAMAAGKPIIITHTPGIEEIATDGVNARVIGSDDLNAAAGALVQLLDDPAELARLSAGAAATDVSPWSIEAMCSGIDAVYGELQRVHHAASSKKTVYQNS